MESVEQMNETLRADATNPDAFNFNAFMKAIKTNASDGTNQVKTYIDRQPGFFTPYRGVVDFGDQAAKMVISPILAVVGTAVVAAVAAIAAATAIGSLLFAGGAALFGQTDAASTALLISGVSALVACVAAAATICSAVGALLAFPIALGQFLSRGVSTVVSPLINCCAPQDEEQNSDQYYPHQAMSV